MRVADAIFQRLKAHTDTVYYLPGGGAMFLIDAGGRSGLNMVSCIHEQGAGFAALGHAMINGKGKLINKPVIDIKSIDTETQSAEISISNRDVVTYEYGLGVCLVTSGPGATNAMTACLAAWCDSIPVLFISGQARTEVMNGMHTRSKGLQYVDAVRMVKPITKRAYEPQSGADALMALDDMILECMSGRRGPCWLSVPQDVQAVEV